MQVVSRVAERLRGALKLTQEKKKKKKRLKKLGNTRKISKLHRLIAWCSVFLIKWIFFQYYKKTLKKYKLIFSVVPYFTWKLDFVSKILSMIVAYCSKNHWFRKHVATSKGSTAALVFLTTAFAKSQHMKFCCANLGFFEVL